MVEPIVRPRMPELDTLRGIAILSVFLFHGFGGLTGNDILARWQKVIVSASSVGWAGVNLFFVLSGFLITGILLDSADKPNYYMRFYSRRALRILPAYYLMLLVMTVWNFVTGTPRGETAAFAGLSFIYLSNLAPMFGVAMLYPLLWSLSVEEHFYLLWPSVIRQRSRKGVAIIALAVCVVEPLLRLYALSTGTELWWAGPHHGGTYSYTWMTADGLAMGALVALFARSAWGKRDNFLKVAMLALVVTVAMGGIAVIAPEVISTWLRATLVNYAALAMVTGALWLGTGPHRAWVNIRLLSFYGYISYGLYLVHGWIFGVYDAFIRRYASYLAADLDFSRTCLQLAVCAIVATGVAYLSRATYEEYFLRVKDKVSKSKPKVGAAVTA